MRIIALMNQKGGVGKTTTAVNLGAALAEAGSKVCLVDLDPQSHLSINCGIDPAHAGPSLYDVLIEQQPLAAAIHRLTDRLSVVPASIDLAGAEVELVRVPARQTILKQRIEACESDFDYMILDCPPSLGLLTLNALAAAGEVIIPMQPHFLALQGVGKLLETVALVARQVNPALRVSGIVLTMFDSQTKLSGEVVKDLRDFLAAAAAQSAATPSARRPWSEAVIFQTRIRRNVKLAESPGFGQTILQYDTASHGAADYRALAGEVQLLRVAPPVSVPVASSAVA
jgi:chromosome partitioning protein